MLTQELKTSRTAAMPKLDGFMKWRIRPAIGACRKCFWLTATTTPNSTGQNWLLAYSSMFTARAVMCDGSRNS